MRWADLVGLVTFYWDLLRFNIRRAVSAACVPTTAGSVVIRCGVAGRVTHHALLATRFPFTLLRASAYLPPCRQRWMADGYGADVGVLYSSPSPFRRALFPTRRRFPFTYRPLPACV